MAWICLRSYLRPTERCGACLAVPHHCEALPEGACPWVQKLHGIPFWLQVSEVITNESPMPPLPPLTLVRIEYLQSQAPALSKEAASRSTKLAAIMSAPTGSSVTPRVFGDAAAEPGRMSYWIAVTG